MSRKIVIAGGSGFLGREFTEFVHLQNDEVVILTREPTASTQKTRSVYWDGKTAGEWEKEIDGCDALLNLTGKSVNCRYTSANKREIVESRVNSAKALAAAISKVRQPPKVWIQAASLAIYGDTGSRICDESAPIADGFSAEVCKSWEGEFFGADTPNTRKVLFRIGFALGKSEGALKMLSLLAKCFLGGATGNGQQYISWLHVSDLNRIFDAAIRDTSMNGIYNATGPEPVTNEVFMRELRMALHRPWSPPVPAPLVHLGSFFLRTEAELALSGRRCIPRRLQEEHGFKFSLPSLKPALSQAV